MKIQRSIIGFAQLSDGSRRKARGTPRRAAYKISRIWSSLMPVILILLIFVVQTFGQEYPITDRSLAYTTAPVLAKGTLQVEGGYFSVNDLENMEGLNLTGFSSLTRFAFHERMEFRVTMALNSFVSDPSDPSTRTTGLSSLQTSLKTNIIHESTYLPAFSLLVNMEWDFLGKAVFRPERPAFLFRVIVEKVLNHRFIAGTNIGLWWRDHINAIPTYSFSLRTAIHEKWALYAEFYGQNSPVTPSENYVDMAIEHWIFDDLIIDLAIGKGISHFAASYFVSLGAAIRFSRTE